MPSLSTNIVFYKSQLWTYNLGIHEVDRNQGCMHMWNEAVGGRGSSEVGSCVLLHLKEMNLSSSVTHLITYSDSCGGKIEVWIWSAYGSTSLHVTTSLLRLLTKSSWSPGIYFSPTTGISVPLSLQRRDIQRSTFLMAGKSWSKEHDEKIPSLSLSWPLRTLYQ